MSVLLKSTILKNLKELKKTYLKEGFVIKALFGSYSRGEATDKSDIDILVEATPQFASRYGFQAIRRIQEIESEISAIFKIPVDLADSTGMGKTAKRFILDRAIYV